MATMLWITRLRRIWDVSIERLPHSIRHGRGIDMFIRAHKFGTIFSVEHIQRCAARYKYIVNHVVRDGGRWGMLRRSQNIDRPVRSGRRARPHVVVDSLRLVERRPPQHCGKIDDVTCCGNSIWWNWIPLLDNATTAAPAGTLARLQAKLRSDCSDIIRDFS